MKRLLVNADDFALCRGVTDGIIETHRRGIVTSTSIIAGGADFEHAVKRARACPGLDVGVHLTLIEERPVSDLRYIRSLLGDDGRLPGNYAALLSGIALGRIRLADIDKEMRAQVEKCVRAGLTPTHLDSHQHVHAFPAIMRLVLDIASDYGIRGIRLPRDTPSRASGIGSFAALAKSLLCMLARYDARALSVTGFSTCDRAAGIYDSGKLSEDRLLRILDRITDGDTELVCHPGHEAGTDLERYSHWDYHWQTELAALTSTRVRQMLERCNIVLIGYRDLCAAGSV